MPKFIDRTNQVVNGSIILQRANTGKKQVEWVCKCKCGNIFVTRYEHLKRSGHCPKCGRLSQSALTQKHGKYKTKLYSVWVQIRQRCNNCKCKSYPNYGGRGIKVCQEWDESFLSFEEWALNNGYAEGLSIDRIDNNGNYEPGNCRWTTDFVQSRNKRNNHMITYNGETLTLTDMAIKYGYEPRVIDKRLRTGWTIERTFTEPKKVI